MGTKASERRSASFFGPESPQPANSDAAASEHKNPRFILPPPSSETKVAEEIQWTQLQVEARHSAKAVVQSAPVVPRQRSAAHKRSATAGQLLSMQAR